MKEGAFTGRGNVFHHGNVFYFVMPGGVRNFSFFSWSEIEYIFLASLGIAKGVGVILRNLFSVIQF
jgi:hypothetical protein